METIGFERIPAVYRQVVLGCINHLRQLTIIGCIDVDPIIELFPLNRLESLNIADSTLAPIANAAELAMRIKRFGPFLPKLRIISIHNTRNMNNVICHNTHFLRSLVNTLTANTACKYCHLPLLV